MAEIVLDDVWKVYSDGTEAVRALDLDIADKEFMVLVGPSGCGKTTALRMVAGLEVISRGDDLDRRARRQRPAAEGTRHRDGVPELRAVPAHVACSTTWRSASSSRRCRRRRSTSACTTRRASSGSTELLEPQAQGALGRAAPARRDGPRHRAPSAGVPDGRAAVEPRREAARPDALGDRAHPARPRRHDDLRDARPDRSDDDGRSRRRAAQGRVAAGRQPADAVRAPGQRVRRRVHRLAGDEPRRRQARPARATASSSSSAGSGCRCPSEVVAARPDLRKYADRLVVLGIRPEDMEDASLVADAPAERRITLDRRPARGARLRRRRALHDRRARGNDRRRQGAGGRRRHGSARARAEAGGRRPLDDARPAQPAHEGAQRATRSSSSSTRTACTSSIPTTDPASTEASTADAMRTEVRPDGRPSTEQ